MWTWWLFVPFSLFVKYLLPDLFSKRVEFEYQMVISIPSGSIENAFWYNQSFLKLCNFTWWEYVKICHFWNSVRNSIFCMTECVKIDTLLRGIIFEKVIGGPSVSFLSKLIIITYIHEFFVINVMSYFSLKWFQVIWKPSG